MSLKKMLVTIRDNYVIRQAWNAALPEFPDTRILRHRVTFSGRVQNVGFRLEVSELAKRLGLTGYCRNLPNGDVEVELQGTRERIRFLVDFMSSLKRIRIDQKLVKAMEPDPGEKDFLTI